MTCLLKLQVLYVAVSASHVTLSYDCGKISVVYSSIYHINAIQLSSPILSCNTKHKRGFQNSPMKVHLKTKRARTGGKGSEVDLMELTVDEDSVIDTMLVPGLIGQVSVQEMIFSHFTNCWVYVCNLCTGRKKGMVCWPVWYMSNGVPSVSCQLCLSSWWGCSFRKESLGLGGG